MDNQRFDRLSRHVGKQSTRRGALKAAAGGTLALLGMGAISRTAAAATGFEDEPCMANTECRQGLFCQGGSTGILGGALADANYGPAGISLPVLTGRTGRCRYNNGCANEGQACRRNDDCCNNSNLECNNNNCRRR